jgi:hypothetical protein
MVLVPWHRNSAAPPRAAMARRRGKFPNQLGLSDADSPKRVLSLVLFRRPAKAEVLAIHLENVTAVRESCQTSD